MSERVYLDYNATAPLRAEAVAAVRDILSLTGNASSIHAEGRAARAIVEKARDQVASLVKARPEQVVFTSGGTEANALALAQSKGGVVMVSAVEHDSVRAVAPAAIRIEVGHSGTLDIGALEAILQRTRPALVSTMLANNETGALQPVDEAAALARAAGAIVHCDAVQAAGKIDVDMTGLGVDLLSLSAHKIGGPQGVGALVVAEGFDLMPMFKGGGQEKRRRPGTENVAGIAGFGAACAAASADFERLAGLAAMRGRLEAEVRRLFPDTVIAAENAERLPNTSCLAVPGVKAETLVMALDLEGIAIGAGAACSSGKVTPSHVLQAMGYDPELTAGAIRISLGWASRDTDIDRFLVAFEPSVERIRRRAAA